MVEHGIDMVVVREIQALARKHGVSKVILFGSRARGDFRPKSDIDLAVKGGDFINFSLDVDEETSTLRLFDFVDLDEAVPDALRAVIENEGVVLYEQA